MSGTGIITHSDLVPQCGKYLASTTHFKIPILSGVGVPGGPSTLSEYCEQRAVNIIDHQLEGAIAIHGGNGHGVFEEGTYEHSGISTVVLHDLRAMVKGVFVENHAGEDIEWQVDDTQDQFLFIKLVEEGDSGSDDYRSSRQFGEFTTRTSTSHIAGSEELLLALKPSGVSSIISINVPKGDNARQEFTTVQNHIFKESPHGGLWRQDDLYISGITGFESFITGRDETTILVSGVFVSFDHTLDSTATFNGNIIVESGLTLEGKFLVDDTLIAIRRSDVVNFWPSNMVFVESGLDVFSRTDIRNPWTFDNLVGFVPESGIFGIKTSDGIELKLVDISENASVLFTHKDAINPHRLIASGVTPQAVGVLSMFGDTLHGNLAVNSGISLDGIDFSTLQPLINGSVISTQHKHFLLQNPEYQFFIPHYPNSIMSGVFPGWLETGYDPIQDKNYYSWFSLYSGTAASARIIIKPSVPEGFEYISGITILSRVSSGTTIGNVNLQVYDTNNTKVGELHQLRNTFWGIDNLSGITGTFEQGSQYKMQVDLTSDFGIGVHVSDIIVSWAIG